MNRKIGLAVAGAALVISAGAGTGIAIATASPSNGTITNSPLIPQRTSPPWSIVVESGSPCHAADTGLHAYVNTTAKVVTCNGHAWK